MMVFAHVLSQNSPQSIDQVVASAAALVDRWVVVDVGSSEGTSADWKEAVPQEKLDFQQVAWCEDFSALRNLGLDRIDQLREGKPCWVIWLDADNLLTNPEVWEEALEHPQLPPVVFLPVTSAGGHDQVSSRLFRGDMGFRFTHPVNEELETGKARAAMVWGGPGVEHTGWATPKDWERTLRRNLGILASLPSEDPWRIEQEVEILLKLKQVFRAAEVASRGVSNHTTAPLTSDLCWQALIQQAGAQGNRTKVLEHALDAIKVWDRAVSAELHGLLFKFLGLGWLFAAERDATEKGARGENITLARDFAVWAEAQSLYTAGISAFPTLSKLE